ncbi:hypothetical protein BN7_2432 [Wickerhamomyces ciferrii]|uniref:Uncharacterized protein n=1 Tax=Wickerhamomyces ciferrii (strain ATCC 14091 / BCRC 22168 / CBS 111 / JCM 3599 / NBRC 0793 / NRRL Y-1031 F-60-10) TaxID=1206466 RepID=K0KL38_WICCF|nr:uncharacterized protein BN7_2432 [Wickerhamomyces ciferrii]CCH42887.1 hypothetical protein BN7_2432 [Wickerhamomyces ciferrii]
MNHPVRYLLPSDGFTAAPGYHPSPNFIPHELPGSTTNRERFIREETNSMRTFETYMDISLKCNFKVWGEAVSPYDREQLAHDIKKFMSCIPRPINFVEVSKVIMKFADQNLRDSIQKSQIPTIYQFPNEEELCTHFFYLMIPRRQVRKCVNEKQKEIISFQPIRNVNDFIKWKEFMLNSSHYISFELTRTILDMIMVSGIFDSLNIDKHLIDLQLDLRNIDNLTIKQLVHKIEYYIYQENISFGEYKTTFNNLPTSPMITSDINNPNNFHSSPFYKQQQEHLIFNYHHQEQEQQQQEEKENIVVKKEQVEIPESVTLPIQSQDELQLRTAENLAVSILNQPIQPQISDIPNMQESSSASSPLSSLPESSISHITERNRIKIPQNAPNYQGKTLVVLPPNPIINKPPQVQEPTPDPSLPLEESNDEENLRNLIPLASLMNSRSMTKDSSPTRKRTSNSNSPRKSKIQKSSIEPEPTNHGESLTNVETNDTTSTAQESTSTITNTATTTQPSLSNNKDSNYKVSSSNENVSTTAPILNEQPAPTQTVVPLLKTLDYESIQAITKITKNNTQYFVYIELENGQRARAFIELFRSMNPKLFKMFCDRGQFEIAARHLKRIEDQYIEAGNDSDADYEDDEVSDE